MRVPDPEPGGVPLVHRTMSSRHQLPWLAAPLAVRVPTGRSGAMVKELQRCGVRLTGT